MKKAVCVVLVSLLMSVRGGATTVIPVTFEQMVDEAAAVVFARVSEVRGQWTADRQAIDSIIRVEALQYLKGDLGAVVSLRLPGGEAAGTINVIPGAPSFRAGDLAVLFLQARGPALLTTVGLSQGVFRVARDPRTGGMLVRPAVLKDSAGGRRLRDAADRRALNVDALASLVEAAAAR